MDNHSVLGRTTLPQSLTSLFTLALHGSAILSNSFTSVVFEILRVAANFCMDHGKSLITCADLAISDATLDGNRAHLLEAGFPQALVSLLEGYAEAISPLPNTKILAISLPHLKVIKTAIGVLLNASIGFGTTHHGCVYSSDLISQMPSNTDSYLWKLP